MSYIDDEIIDELLQHEYDLRKAFRVPVEERQEVARRMQANGVKPCASTGIHGYITYGYGLLDQFGFWQYPLPDGEFVGD